MQVIELLIDKGANIHQMDYHDHSPLHYACVWGWVDTVELLLEKGADPRRFGELQVAFRSIESEPRIEKRQIAVLGVERRVAPSSVAASRRTVPWPLPRH